MLCPASSPQDPTPLNPRLFCLCPALWRPWCRRSRLLCAAISTGHPALVPALLANNRSRPLCALASYTGSTLLFACHPVILRIVSLLRQSFWLPSLERACYKSRHQAPPGFLQPLPVPSRSWSHIVLEFVTGLPHSLNYSVILTIVDRFSKAAHFVLLFMLPSALETANLLVDHVFRLLGIPRDIVSNRGPQISYCTALGAESIFGLSPSV